MKRNNPDVYSSTRLLGPGEPDDLENHVHPKAVAEVSSRCDLSENDVLYMAIQGASTYRRIRDGAETLFS